MASRHLRGAEVRPGGQNVVKDDDIPGRWALRMLRENVKLGKVHGQMPPC
jgi:hypothetical protein